MKIIYFLLTFFAIMISCTSQKKAVVETLPNQVVNMNIEDPGKIAFQTNCSTCHTLYSETKFTPEEWEPIVYDMQKKGGISDSEIQLILNYLKSNAK